VLLPEDRFFLAVRLEVWDESFRDLIGEGDSRAVVDGFIDGDEEEEEVWVRPGKGSWFHLVLARGLGPKTLDDGDVGLCWS
jgi:hypothetical protein